MDTKRPSDNDRSAAAEGVHTHMVSRRALTRAGLSGSVLLGSLASKPVLGAASVGCTVSGQMSGNLSREALTFNCRVGNNRSYWIGAASWPSPAFTKGTSPQSNCSFGGGGTVQGTLFNGWTPGVGVPPLMNAFYRDDPTGPTTCTVVTASLGADGPATMLQVLNTDPLVFTDPRFQLGRIVVVSLLNVAQFGLDYPVTYHTVIDMFNATFGGGSYVVGTVSWDRTRVIQYLGSLVAL